MKNFIKNTAIITSTEALLMIIAIAKNKYLAMYVGTIGFGIYGLLNSFFGFFAVLSGSSLNTAVVKYTAYYHAKKDFESTKKILYYSLYITLLISLSLIILFATFSDIIINWFLSSEIKHSYFILYAFVFFFNTFVSIYLGFLQGIKNIKAIVTVRLFVSIIDLCVMIVLVWYLKLLGFFIGLLASSVVTFVLYRVYLPKKNGFFFKFEVRRDFILNKLLRFGGINIFLSLFNLGTQFFLRMIVLNQLGIESVGVLQAGLSLMNYLNIVNNGAVFNYLPQISEENNFLDRNIKINQFLRYTLIFNIPIAVIAILFGPKLILILFSYRFASLSSVFNFLVIGYFMNAIMQAFQFNLLGMEKLKTYSIISIVGSFILILFPLFLIKSFGLISIGAGYIFSYAVGILLFYLSAKKYLDFKFTKQVINLLLISIVFIIISLTIIEFIIVIKILFIVVACLVMGTSIKKEEYLGFSTKIMKKLKGI